MRTGTERLSKGNASEDQSRSRKCGKNEEWHEIDEENIFNMFM